MQNRKVPPPIIRPETIRIPNFEDYVLDNGTRVCEIHQGEQEILKIEIVHRAGRSTEATPLASRAVAALMKEGCGGRSSREIAETIDYFGASLKTGANMDFSYSTFYSLTRYAPGLIPLLAEMYYSPDFAEEEIRRFVSVNVEKLREELTKNEVISYRSVTEVIFGASHPYGYNSLEKDYTALHRDTILTHHSQWIGSDNAFIFISGKITDDIRKEIRQSFGAVRHKTPVPVKPVCNQAIKGQKIRIHSRKEHQSAIKAGRRLFDKNHPDNAGFFVLNTILGGYFGSRLMKSIREEKGYTYDIYSTIDQMLYDGCFYISTEADTSYIEPLLQEMYHQMDMLQQDIVGDEELQMVKNYIMGNFMNMLDGAMNLGGFIKSMVTVDQSQEEFIDFVNKILNADGPLLRDLAQTYLRKEDLTEVVVTPEDIQYVNSYMT